MRTGAVGLVLLAMAASANAQNTTAPVPSTSDGPQVYRTTGARIGIGRSIHVPVDEEVSEAVVVVGGSARIDGRVRDGVVVVGGNLDFGPKADVRGEIVLVGCRIHREPGAQIRGRVNDIRFGDWSSWSIGGLSVPVVQFGDLGRWLSLFGTVFRVALLALLMAIFLLVARAPIARIGRSAAAEPGRAFAIGLLAELLFVPVLIVATVSLIISLVGIPLVFVLVPAAFVALFVALLLGFTALACRLGEWLGDRLGLRGDSALLTTTIGLMLIVGPTLAARSFGLAPDPFGWAGFGLLAVGVAVEFLVWTIGLGAALMTGFGRWSTAPPPVPPPVQAGILPAVN